MKKLFLVFLTILFNGCASIPKNKLNLIGIVQNNAGESICQAEIYCNESLVSLSDFMGHFFIEDIMNNSTYKINVLATGYLPKEMDVQFSSSCQLLYIRLDSLEEIFNKSIELFSQKKFFQCLELCSKLKDSMFTEFLYLSSACLIKSGDVEAAKIYLSLIEKNDLQNDFYFQLLSEVQ